MFQQLPPPPVDGILALAAAFRDDKRVDKIDLGIGVYKDRDGRTPVMRAVKSAEQSVWETETSKAYLGLAGDEQFCAEMTALVLGGSVAFDRVRSLETTGSGAAVRLIADLFATDGTQRTIWLPAPTWINHIPIAEAAGLQVRRYAYLDRATSEIDFSAMMADLAAAQAGDVLLLHGCCHNPSGADLTDQQWQEVTALVSSKGLFPFLDIAYQGFGDGLEPDARGLRRLAASVPEMLIASSCSKNFGVYRDRVGAAIVIGADTAGADKAKAVLLAKGRVNYSFPPNHGAATVARVLLTPSLRVDWEGELEAMRQRMVGNRAELAQSLMAATGTDRFDFVKRHKGMFSLLGLDVAQVTRLREEFGIFLPSDGRMNVAALREDHVDRFSKAISAVI